MQRAVHTLSQEATELYQTAREEVARFVNARDMAETVFVRGTTEAINLVAYSWGLRNLGKGDEVLVSLMEHHSNILPWEILSKINGYSLRYAKVNDLGVLDVEDLANKLSEKTKIVCLSHVSNVTGVINDIKRITRLVHEQGALILVDGAQSVPHIPVDLQDLDVDFLAFSGHKMLGPTGIGVLYAKKELLESMAPFQGGGEMVREVKLDHPSRKLCIAWNEIPWKFEAGTPNICGAIGLAEAIRYISEIGMTEIAKHELSLTEYATKLMEDRKVQTYGPRDLSLRCGIIPFNVEGLSSHDVALFFDNYGIMIRSGVHCAHPLHQTLNLQASARASFYVYNTKEEIDRFVDVLKEIERF